MKSQNGFSLVQVIIAAGILVLVGAGALFFSQQQEIKEPVICTDDAKECPDGSLVGRTGSDCAFAECPEVEKIDEGEQKAAEREIDMIPLNENINDIKFIEIGKEYIQAASPADVNGRLAYVARDHEQGRFIVYDGQEIGKEYDFAYDPVELNGKLGYRVTQTEGVAIHFIVYNNQEIGREYGSAADPIVISEKLAYLVYSPNKEFIVYDDQEIGKEYDTTSSPIEVNNKLVFMASKNKENFIVYDGQEIGKEYDRVNNPIDVGGKLAYGADKDSESFIVYNGQEIGKEYDRIKSIFALNDKLAFVAVDNSKIFIVYDGKKIDYTESDFISISNLVWAGGGIAYIAENTRSRKKFVNYDGQEIGKEYKEIFYITSIGDKLVMSVKGNDGKIFLVMEK